MLKKRGIKCFDLKNKLENKFDIKKINEIRSIFKKYNINQVHIHQLSCALNVWAACILENIPYVFYIHTTVPIEDCEWFENQFLIYKKMLSIFFENAYKIIGITPKSINSHNERFSNVEKQKYKVIPNSINFEQYKSKKKVQQIKRFLIISRLSAEKLEQIKRSICLFANYKEKYSLSDIKLDIVGDGNKKQEIEEFIKNKEIKNVKLLPSSYEIEKLMDNYDVIMGIGRCVLEAIAMKKIAVLSGFYNINGIIDKNNINKAMQLNFVGKNMEQVSEEQIMEKINYLNNNPEKIEEITEKNYSFIYNNRNIDENVFYINENIKMNYENIELFNIINSIIEDFEKEKQKSEEIWESKEWINNQYQNELNYIKTLENTIQQMKNGQNNN